MNSFKEDSVEIPKNDSKTQLDILIDESGIKLEPKVRVTKKPKSDTQAWYYLGFIGEIGFTIAIPIGGGALLGKYLDTRLSTYPKATLLLLFLGIIISLINFIRTIAKIINDK